MCRKLTAFGIPPLVAFIAITPLFYYLSITLFENFKHSKFVYPLIAVSILLKTTYYAKDNFLKAHYLNTKVYKIRCIENLLISIPFFIFLIFKNQIYIALSLLFISLFMGFKSFRLKTSFYIPTPFSKKPFEFSVGFRKALLGIPIPYALSVISVYVGNLNLGIFALLLLFVLCSFFYFKIEPEYYIWNHQQNPKEFLRFKIKQALFNFLKLGLPICILLSVFFINKILIVLFFIILISLALAVLILLKYSTNNKEINPIQLFIFYLSVFIFPFLLLLLPYYYKQAIQQLSKILE